MGKMALKPPSLSSGEIRRFMQWVDDKRSNKIKVLTNADTPADAAEARRNGAQGIGLARTEHMFFSADRINVVRRMILAPDEVSKAKALAELLPFQRADFEGMLEAMDGLPVTVRLLDPPLHEFLPPAELIDAAFAHSVAPGLTPEAVSAMVEKMAEVNPMLGLRGCRLGITVPELVEMQVTDRPTSPSATAHRPPFLLDTTVLHLIVFCRVLSSFFFCFYCFYRYALCSRQP